MPIITPELQALKDFQQGLTHRDANPYLPHSQTAPRWVAAMIELEKAEQSQPREVLPAFN